MRSHTHKPLIRHLVLASLAICFSAGLLSAQQPVFVGKFSLPFETRWGTAVLPAGDYSVRFFGSGFGQPVVIRQGTRTIAMVEILTTETPSTPARSQLLVVREGKTATVHILYAAELGTEFHFRVPERYEVETRLLTQASEPAVIERIPIIVSGK